MCEINRFRRLSQALVHFVIDRASLFTDYSVSGLPASVPELCEVLNELHVCSLTGLPGLYYSDSCFQELRRSDSTNQAQGYHPNLNPASKEMISDSVELCETEDCFLHIQLIGTNV